MAYDYRSLLKSEDGITDTWRELYNDNLLLSENLLNILKQTVLLPHDHYDVIIDQEPKNAKNGGRPLEIYTAQLRQQINNWVEMGWLYEKPKGKVVKELMLDLGMRLQQGKWRKG